MCTYMYVRNDSRPICVEEYYSRALATAQYICMSCRYIHSYHCTKGVLILIISPLIQSGPLDYNNQGTPHLRIEYEYMQFQSAQV